MRNITSLQIHNREGYIEAVFNFMDMIASHHSGMEFSRCNRLRYVVGEILEDRIPKAYSGGDGIIEIIALNQN